MTAGSCELWTRSQCGSANVIAVIGDVSGGVNLKIQIRKENVAQFVDGYDRVAVRLPDVVVGRFRKATGSWYETLRPTRAVVGRESELAEVEAAILREVADHRNEIVEVLWVHR